MTSLPPSSHPSRALHLALVAGLLLTTPATARADITAGEYGDYFCYFLHAASTNKDNEPGGHAAGAVNLGDKWGKFFLKVEPMKRTFAEVVGCKKYLDYFASNLREGEALYDLDPMRMMPFRSAFALTCPATARLTVRFSGGDVTEFYALESLHFARESSIWPGWMSLDASGRFEMNHEFGLAQVIADGRCERLTPPATPR